MDQKDLEALVAALAPIIKEFVRDQLAVALQPVQADLVALADKSAQPGAPGEPGRDGKDGQDAPTVDQIRVMVESAVAALPRAVDGQPGKDGAPGRDGQDGATQGQILEMVKEAVGGAVAALPRAVDGQPGKDGVGLAGAVIDRSGQLAVTLSNGLVVQLGGVVGKDGTPGRDGFGFEDLAVSHDGGRNFTLEFTRGGEAKTFTFTIPALIYRGIWEASQLGYCKGDVVTRAGSAWVAVQDPAPGEEPGGASAAWQLAVKRGANGKDGQMKAVPAVQPVQVS